jgi:hypothetical protein
MLGQADSHGGAHPLVAAADHSPPFEKDCLGLLWRHVSYDTCLIRDNRRVSWVCADIPGAQLHHPNRNDIGPYTDPAAPSSRPRTDVPNAYGGSKTTARAAPGSCLASQSRAPACSLDLWGDPPGPGS